MLAVNSSSCPLIRLALCWFNSWFTKVIESVCSALIWPAVLSRLSAFKLIFWPAISPLWLSRSPTTCNSTLASEEITPCWFTRLPALTFKACWLTSAPCWLLLTCPATFTVSSPLRLERVLRFWFSKRSAVTCKAVNPDSKPLCWLSICCAATSSCSLLTITPPCELFRFSSVSCTDFSLEISPAWLLSRARKLLNVRSLAAWINPPRLSNTCAVWVSSSVPSLISFPPWLFNLPRCKTLPFWLEISPPWLLFNNPTCCSCNCNCGA